MENEKNEVILLTEDDEEVRFEHLATLEYNDNQYVILSPMEEMEGVEEDEVVILRIEKDNQGQDVYVGLDDEREIKAVFSAFEQLYYEE
ncbi:MAG: DUF1292 domain-containing protein [Clostridia bacterium]|nr:DUF1292 domain-containing protein [Clostridia bacterium]